MSTTARLAQDVAPPIDGDEIWTSNNVGGNAMREARYHIARAWAFHQGTMLPTSVATKDLVTGLLYEFHLALLYRELVQPPRDRCCKWGDDRIASAIAADLANPDLMGSAIYELLEWADLDPASILPYGQPEVSA